MELVYQEKELPQVADALWQAMQTRPIVALHGEMGAGKTTLVHALCQQLRVTDAVSSPTFSIINEYELPEQDNVLYHIDLYRLKNPQEAITTGVEDCLYSQAFAIVEWPERAPETFPDNTLHVYIHLLPNGDRCIKFDN